jgi:demethylmenaquinone methyltransferase/2-methoxy-6-polyprenyl-1,4-benzoquinol methylase
VGSTEARTGTLEEVQVRAMFDRIARVYDRMNSVMTAGLHHRWRERAADLANVGPGSRALDVATGTGDLAIALARRVEPGGEVVGSDFSEGMLALARRKAPALRWEWANALALPYADGAFDAATVGFGARNFSDRVVPAFGRFADSDAYTYLPSSVRRFPGPEALAARMERAGLADIRWILTAGGIIALHAGTVVR